MPTDDELKQALVHTEIALLRQIGDALATQSRSLENLTNKVDDVRERVIRLEAAKSDVAIQKLESRVNDLESARDRVSGATTFFSWLGKNAPWLFAFVAAGIAYFKK